LQAKSVLNDASRTQSQFALQRFSRQERLKLGRLIVVCHLS
jgi:hypothetical protein